MERPDAMQEGRNKRRTLKFSSAEGKEAKAKKVNSSAQTNSPKTKSANLRIHHAYVHASLFKDFASINPEQLPSGKWKIEINFKNHASICPVVENEKDVQKISKKVLDYQKKYGAEVQTTDAQSDNYNEGDSTEDDKQDEQEEQDQIEKPKKEEKQQEEKAKGKDSRDKQDKQDKQGSEGKGKGINGNSDKKKVEKIMKKQVEPTTLASG